MQTAPTVKRPLVIPQTWWIRAMAAMAMLALLAITAPLITLAVSKPPEGEMTVIRASIGPSGGVNPPL